MIGLAGCSEPTAGVVGTGPPVIVPDAPGSPGRTATPGERLQTSAEPVAADVRFAEQMIPHHRQALEMTGLVAARTTTPAIRKVAERIALTQEPEIRRMTEWLAALGRTPDHAGHSAASMPGMATPQQMEALRAARGAQFDRLFLELMIRHHEGALRMAKEELAAGRDQQMLLMAKDVYSEQAIEITRMRELAGS
ncbi:DUF305 domain-containing protein [Thermoactinospora rubra]|uniref:DUF305 domain-containing protein n=1 Tax=Thermoactinospora rubra TaxID=1088767 RepID=UPI000A108ECA|nr:DUF305 domain-containing protein [Thermoactinospora rubra]